MAETNASGAAVVAAPATVDPELSKPADLKPATDMAASGALIEPEIVAGVDTAHPAVDANPRATTRVVDNRIDFNDPTVPGHVQVARRLGLADDYDAPKGDAKADKKA